MASRGVALVTGANRGLGLAFSKALATCNKICSCILITTCVTINFVRRLYNNQLLESPKESLFKPAILVSAGLGWRLCLLQVAITPQKHKLYQSREKRFD